MSKTVTHYPPCPVYETRRFEQWLEDMAKDGWFLAHFTASLFGSIKFTKSEPSSVRFRLQPAPKKAGRFSRRDRRQEAVDLAADFGWVLQDIYQGYFVYYTINPDVPELDTDPQVQALALQEHRRKKRIQFYSGLALTALVLVLLVWRGPIYYSLNNSQWYQPLLFLILLFALFLQWKELQYLKHMQKQLAEGCSNGKRLPSFLHKAAIVSTIAACFLPALIPTLNALLPWQAFRWKSAAEDPGVLPFATIEEVTGETLDPSHWSVDHNNEYASRATLLASRQIVFQQYGEITYASGETVNVAIRIDYYEMRSEWLAKQLFREIQHQAALSRGEYTQYIDHEDPNVPVDQVDAYSVYEPTLLLRQDSRVMRLRFIPDHKIIRVYFDQWAPAFAESILD